MNRQRKLTKTSKGEWIMNNSKGFPVYLKNVNEPLENIFYQSRKQNSDSLSSSFHIKEEVVNCYDGVFPNARLNGVLISTE